MKKSIVLFLIILASCAESKNEYESFTIKNGIDEERVNFQPSESRLKGEPLKGLGMSNGFISPRDIDLTPDLLLVTESKSDDLIQIYSREDNSLVANFNKKGYGPGELLRAAFVEFVDGGKRLSAYDGNRDVVSLMIVDSLNNEGYEAYQLKVDNFVDAPQYINDSLFVGLDTQGEGRLAFVDETGMIVKRTGKLPETDRKDVIPYVLAHAYDAKIEYAQEQKKIVVSNRYTDRIELYSDLGEPVAEINGPLFFEPDYQVINMGEAVGMAKTKKTRYGFVDVYVAPNYFYVLYSGKTDAELPREAHFGDQVYIFDYQGRPQEHFRLDRRVLRIAVDEEASLLYASDFTNQDHNIIRYEFR